MQAQRLYYALTFFCQVRKDELRGQTFNPENTEIFATEDPDVFDVYVWELL